MLDSFDVGLDDRQTFVMPKSLALTTVFTADTCFDVLMLDSFVVFGVGLL